MHESDRDARTPRGAETEAETAAGARAETRAAAPEPESFRLSDASLAQLEALRPRYPTREALLLPALWLVQREAGWISRAAMQHVAELLGVSPVRVYAVMSFYHMFHERPPGRHNIQVCHNLSCSLRGAEALLERLHALLGVEEDEPTPDGRYMVQRVECLGACEHAPVIQVNDEFRFDVTPEQLERLLEELP